MVQYYVQYLVVYCQLVTNLKTVSNFKLNYFHHERLSLHVAVGSRTACNLALCVQALGNHSNILIEILLDT